jgi:2-polyprenyl-3-methyl-5-hydroxy-6-metoxy-1,4-benzoquinol methylase
MNSSNPYTIKTDRYSSHSVILKWLTNLPNKTKVIEVGIAEGILGKLDRNRNYQLVGIELNESWAIQANDYYDKVIIGDIRNLDKEIFNDVDCIILADVLEHLSDPNAVLNRIREFIPSECVVILSVPNIANLWVRINLLFGKFNYSERGILDKTHLRFFTKDTFNQLIRESNLDIINLDYTPIPLGLVHSFFIDNKVGMVLFKFLNFLSHKFPTLLSYQLIAYCKKV